MHFSGRWPPERQPAADFVHVIRGLGSGHLDHAKRRLSLFRNRTEVRIWPPELIRPADDLINAVPDWREALAIPHGQAATRHQEE